MRSPLFAALVVSAGLGPAQAGPCTSEIASAQTSFDARVKQVAATGPTAAETTGAKLHRQPTAASVVGAEKQADAMSMERQKAFREAIARAGDEDKAGDPACKKDVADARAALAP